MQLEIHYIENNQESQTHLNENRAHFSDQCRKVLDLLKSGVRLSTVNAPGYGILSLPRRLKDLRDYNGVKINESWVTDGQGKRLYKEWYL